MKLLIHFPNFNTVEVWEWISNFIPHFIMDVITLGLKLIQVSKRGPRSHKKETLWPSVFIIQSSAVITRSNITWYCTHHCDHWCKIKMRAWIHKIHPIPRPNGRAIGVFCESLRENWPRYIGTALYIVITATYPRGQWVTVCCDRSWPTPDCFNGPRKSGLWNSLSRPTLEGIDCEPGNDDNLRKVRIVGNPVTTLSAVVNCQLKTCNSFFVGMLRYIGGLVQGCSNSSALTMELL